MKKIVKFLLSFVLLLTALGFAGGVSQVSAAQFFIKPSAGTYYSPFGYRASTGTYHYGIDISTSAANTAVNSSATGVVRTTAGGCSNNGFYGSTCNGGLGNYIIVRHNANGQIFDTLYAHLSNISVSVNQNVSQGQRIGTMGNSGSSTGQHLHFEIHPGGRVGSSTAENPRPYLDGTKNPAPIVNYHKYDGSWATLTVNTSDGSSAARFFSNPGYGIIGSVPNGTDYKVYSKILANDGYYYYGIGGGYVIEMHTRVVNYRATVDYGYAVNVYDAPNGSYKKRVNPGETYNVYGAKDGWYDLGQNTWIKAEFVKVTKP